MSSSKTKPKSTRTRLKTPLKAIKAKCLDCSGDVADNVKFCPISTCPLFLYRFGVEPTDEVVSSVKRKTAKTTARTRRVGTSVPEDTGQAPRKKGRASRQAVSRDGSVENTDAVNP